MQLISSKIVPASQDLFWAELPEAWRANSPRPCLVLTFPITDGSAQKQTLLKMLGACMLSPDQYHILEMQPGQQLAWHKLNDHYNPEYVLLLGISTAVLSIQALFRLHEPNHYNECIFIPSLSLDDLEKSPEAKKDFWIKGLKPVFIP